MFSVATLLLLGGVADYLVVSALMAGLVAGAFWHVAGGTARESIRRDLRTSPSAGRADPRRRRGADGVHGGHPGTGRGVRLLRAVGKLAGSIAAAIIDPATSPDAAPRVLSPGILGIAFALNACARWDPTWRVVLSRRGARHDRLSVAGRRLHPEDPRVRRLAALALAVAAVLWVRRAGASGPVGSAGTALALGFTLLGAWVTGDCCRRLQLPRLTGYLLFGVLVGPYLGNVITEAMAAQLQVITGIATTLIALIAGLTLNIERLGRQLRAIGRLTAATLADRRCSGSASRAWFAWPWLPIAPDADRPGEARDGARCSSSSPSASRRR